MTLIELTVVLLVLIALAGLVMPYVSGTSSRAACITTEAGMIAIRNAIVGSFENPGYMADMGGLPASLNDLYSRPVGADDFNPVTGRGWRGPYLITAQMMDGFLTNSPITLQTPSNDADGNDCSDLGYADNSQCARLISEGPDGNLDTLPDDANGSSRDDDRILYLFIPDPNSGLSRSCNDL